MIEPPLPITKNLYWCDRVFHVDEVMSLFTSPEIYTLIVVMGEECQVWDVSVINKKLRKRFATSLPNHHHRGGQSQNRLARLRESAHDAYVSGIAEWIQGNVGARAKIMIAGCATKPLELRGMLEKSSHSFRIIHHFTVNDADDAVVIAQRYLTEQEQWSAENEDWKDFEREWSLLTQGRPSRAVYGEKEVQAALEHSLLQRVWVHSHAGCAKDATVVRNPNHPILRTCGGWAGLLFYSSALACIEDP